MKKELSRVTCCNCGATDECDKDEGHGGWLCITEQIQDPRTGRNGEYWICTNQKCIQEISKIITDARKRNSTRKIPQRQDILAMTCDACESTRESDRLNPIIGGSVFGGWMTLTRNREDFDDHDTTELHVCGDRCRKKVSFNLQTG